jgi:transposase InsO family protein
MIEQFPFPVQRIQCDRGREFFAVKVQEKLMKYSIKFIPVKPGSPHLNGKVEHSQQTDLREFYANTDLSNFETLKNQLKEWQFSYNYQHLHGSLKGKTPAQYSGELGVSFHSPKNINSITLSPSLFLIIMPFNSYVLE